MKKVQILVAHDHGIVRHGMRNLINSEGDFIVTWEASSGRDAVNIAEKHGSDIAIIDPGMPDLNGMDTIRQILRVSPQRLFLISRMHEKKRQRSTLCRKFSRLAHMLTCSSPMPEHNSRKRSARSSKAATFFYSED
jgi:DNA-binding NarL/FixJ family response regulator